MYFCDHFIQAEICLSGKHHVCSILTETFIVDAAHFVNM